MLEVWVADEEAWHGLLGMKCVWNEWRTSEYQRDNECSVHDHTIEVRDHASKSRERLIESR